MDIRATLIIGLSIVLGLVGHALILAVGGQQAGEGELSRPRYQLVATAEGNGQSVYFYLLDTRTGRCWEHKESPKERWAVPAAEQWREMTPKDVKQ
ncbi:MAG: hypothetical protein ACYTF6_10820 [Planctomycetota bacterium]|jgi:hypothetical protein